MVDGSTHSSMWKKCYKIKLSNYAGFERERTQLVDQIDQKDQQIADARSANGNQLQLIEPDNEKWNIIARN